MNDTAAIESFITLKYLPVQYTDEYFSNLPDDVIEIIYSKYFIQAQEYAGFSRTLKRMDRRTYLRAVLSGFISQTPELEAQFNATLKQALIGYYNRNENIFS